MSETARLENKAALVTGGTRGIGLAIARRFCMEGARVVIAGTADGPGEQAASDLRARGHEAYFEPVDMAAPSSVQQMVGAAAARLDGLDVLINNAGITGRSTIRRLQVAEWDRVLAVNLRGPVFCMQAAREAMTKGGSIVNISSIIGIDGKYGQASYAASKAGLLAATEVAAREFAKDGIRVNAIAPGMTETDMASNVPPQYRQEVIDRTPLHRVGAPEDIANACTYLASDEARFVTGAVLRVDGGLRF